MSGGIATSCAAVIFFLNCVLHSISADDLVGCGGFVQSDIPINFSQVEVALYTKDGIQKYRTDCAPNNGYFLIPLYEKGDFILRVEPPEGWKFRPDSVELSVDGVSDRCSRGEDINFVFAGFALAGRVVSRGETTGPEGVAVEVRKAGSEDVVTSLLTGPGGTYLAPGLLPGQYVVTAKHERWHMEKHTASVELIDKNADVSESLVVAGYDVHGSVESDGKPTSGVSFLLFGNPKVPVACESVAQANIEANDVTGNLLCEAVSGSNGQFSFVSLPLGEYHLKPYYRSEHITFDVLPKKMTLVVGHGSVVLQDTFRVHGFTVSGRVLASKSGKGLAGAKIVVKGLEKPSIADSNGQYLLEHVRPGVYHVSVEADGYHFKPTDVTVSASAPQLSDLVASEYALCGKVSIASPAKGATPLSSRQIKLLAAGQPGEGVKVSCDDKGSFCFHVPPGKWEVSSVVSSTDKTAGLLLHPASQIVEVVAHPVRDVVFSQFFATLNVEVACMSASCTALPIALQSLTRQDSRRSVMNAVQVDEESAQASVAFKDVLPGQYRLSILYDKWCWEMSSIDVHVGSENVKPVVFRQIGHLLKCLSSHALVLRYRLTDDDDDTNGNDTQAAPEVQGQTDLPVGSGQVCLPRPGTYELTTKSCHKFVGEPFTYSTAVPGVVSLTATTHSVSGSVITTEDSEDLRISVSIQRKSNDGSDPTILGPLRATRAKAEDGSSQFVYHYTHWARSDEVMTIKPILTDMLFDPPVRSVTIPRESCPERIPVFHGRRGVYVAGKVIPAVAGVRITVSFTSDNEIVNLVTDSKGAYSHGPIDSSRQYSVSAFLDGYVIEPEADSATNFRVSKLGEINIEVSAGNEKVSGVLVSLSGGKFRSNNFTNVDGRLRFLNLSPGQYFLRCMLKEFSFEPASKLIDVAEGGTVNVDISANRVSFSCYGATRSLGGIPEAGITVVAAGLDSCQNSRESTVSGSDGTFRLRGLNPGCQYQVEVEGGSGSALRAIPAHRVVTVDRNDLSGVDMVVFQPPSQVELSGYVKSSQPEHLSTVKVSLYVEPHLTSSPVQTIALTDQPFFHFNVLPAVSTPVTYRIALESSLSRSSYADLTAGAHFTVGPDDRYHHATIEFHPRLLITETESSLRHGSLLGVFCVLVLTVCVLNQQKLVSFVTSLMQQYPSGSTDSSSARNSRRR